MDQLIQVVKGSVTPVPCGWPVALIRKRRLNHNADLVRRLEIFRSLDVGVQTNVIKAIRLGKFQVLQMDGTGRRRGNG